MSDTRGDLAGKVAIVTGGGTGIGRACALAFAAQGARVVINYSRSRDEAEQTAADCVAAGGNGIAIQANVASVADVDRLVAETVERWGRLDVLVNNAGTTRFAPYGDLDAMSEEAWDAILSVNLKGAFFAVRAAVPHMRRAGGGSIINVASIAGLRPVGSSVAYGASKAALINMSETLAAGLGPQIRVNAIAPGFIETRWHAKGQMDREAARQATPLKRNGTAEDCAEVALFLATSGRFVTGQTIVVDGGRFL